MSPGSVWGKWSSGKAGMPLTDTTTNTFKSTFIHYCCTVCVVSVINSSEMLTDFFSFKWTIRSVEHALDAFECFCFGVILSPGSCIRLNGRVIT